MERLQLGSGRRLSMHRSPWSCNRVVWMGTGKPLVITVDGVVNLVESLTSQYCENNPDSMRRLRVDRHVNWILESRCVVEAIPAEEERLRSSSTVDALVITKFPRASASLANFKLEAPRTQATAPLFCGASFLYASELEYEVSHHVS